MSMTLMRTIPFIEAHHQGKKQHPKTISLRLSDTTSLSGAALGIANSWHSPNSPTESCHYIVDEELTYQCVPDNVRAVRLRFNDPGIVHINVCATPVAHTKFWEEASYASAMTNAANLTAMLCWTHGIPARSIGLVEHRAFFKRGGIIIDVRGAFPSEHFLDLVRARLRNFKEEGGL